MRPEDVERVGRWKPNKHAEYICMLCGIHRPTCPQLRDEVWAVTWSAAIVRGLIEMPCTCVVYDQNKGYTDGSFAKKRVAHYDDPHCLRNRRRKELLCLECAETCLQRPLSLDDLETCVGNYAHYVMQDRLVDQIRLIRLQLHADGCERATVMIDELAAKLGLL